MNTCESCKFWILLDELELTPVGRCSRAIQFWDATEWGEEDVSFKRVLKPGYENHLLFVQDASDYAARLITRSDFGCILHEEIVGD